MNTEELIEEIDDLLFSLDLNIEMLRDEKIKYLVYSQKYYSILMGLMNKYNYIYLYTKVNNLLFSTNQLMYEADVEQRFWIELTEIMRDSKFVDIYEDIADEIEKLLIIFSQHAMNRFDFCNFYQETFNDFIKNGYVLDDEYYLSEIDRKDYDDLIDKYNKKLIKTKK